MRRPPLAPILLGFALLAPGTGGCRAPVEGHRPASADFEPVARAGWPYWPVTMRVHPLTRVVDDPASGEPLIEARIELKDADGVTSRAVGRLGLALWPADTVGLMDPLNEWLVDLTDPATNAERFDVVTRTYLLKLRTDEVLRQSVRLHVRFESSNGLVLEDRFELAADDR